MHNNSIIDLTRDGTATADSDMIEVVGSLVGCSPKIAKYLLIKNNWDANKTAEEFYSFENVSVNDPDEYKKTTDVREYFGCKLEVAMYLIGTSNWDVGKVLEDVNGLSSMGGKITSLPPRSLSNDNPGTSDELKIVNVVELIKCSSSVAKYLLENYGWDVDKVVEEFFASVKGKPETLPGNTSGGISSVLKRKINAHENNDEQIFIMLRENFVKNLASVRDALNDEENNMMIGDCHKCSAPGIYDSTESILTCPVCKSKTCLKCGHQRHEVGEDCGFKRTRVLPSRSFDSDNELETEFSIAEGQFLRMKRHGGKKYEIKSIDVIENEKLNEIFEKKR